jgi:hypothetical protein
MTSERLAQDAHTNMVEAFAATLPAHQAAGFLERNIETLIAFTGSPIDFFNEVVPVDVPLSAEGLAAAVGTARGTLPWVLHIRAGVDDACLPAASDLGLEEEVPYFYPAMVLTDLPDAELPPNGLEIRAVTDERSFKEHLGAAGGNPAMTRSWLGGGIVQSSDVQLLTGYVGDQPVARSMAYRTSDVIGVFNVGVRDDVRRCGYGWAMTRAAIRSGPTQDARWPPSSRRSWASRCTRPTVSRPSFTIAASETAVPNRPAVHPYERAAEHGGGCLVPGRGGPGS